MFDEMTAIGSLPAFPTYSTRIRSPGVSEEPAYVSIPPYVARYMTPPGEIRIVSTGPQSVRRADRNLVFDTYLPVASTTTSRTHFRENSIRNRWPSMPRGNLALDPPIFQL